jgi:hypothetical protein
VLSPEHSAARWIDPIEYRDRYFPEELIVTMHQRDERVGIIMRRIRANLDAYLAWCAKAR